MNFKLACVGVNESEFITERIKDKVASFIVFGMSEEEITNFVKSSNNEYTYGEMLFVTYGLMASHIMTLFTWGEFVKSFGFDRSNEKDLKIEFFGKDFAYKNLSNYLVLQGDIYNKYLSDDRAVLIEKGIVDKPFDGDIDKFADHTIYAVLPTYKVPSRGKFLDVDLAEFLDKYTKKDVPFPAFKDFETVISKLDCVVHYTRYDDIVTRKNYGYRAYDIAYLDDISFRILCIVYDKNSFVDAHFVDTPKNIYRDNYTKKYFTGGRFLSDFDRAIPLRFRNRFAWQDNFKREDLATVFTYDKSELEEFFGIKLKDKKEIFVHAFNDSIIDTEVEVYRSRLDHYFFNKATGMYMGVLDIFSYLKMRKLDGKYYIRRFDNITVY